MYCNDGKVTNCPICGQEIHAAWTVNQEAKPDGGVHESVGDTFVVTKKCDHLRIIGGADYEALLDPRSYG
jgi:hypothetical protein